LVTRADHFGVTVGVETREIQATSQLVSEVTAYPIPFNKAIVGRNAFAHESGIHAHGVLRERTTCEIMDPAAVGQTGSEIVLGKHSGRAAVGHALREMRIELDAAAFEEVFVRFKDVADRRGRMTAEELLACVDGGAARIAGSG
jgi:2-isopropylmalate synthase